MYVFDEATVFFYVFFLFSFIMVTSPSGRTVFILHLVEIA